MWDRRIPSVTELGALADAWLRLHRLDTEGLWPAFSRSRSWLQVVARIRQPVEEYAAWAEVRPPQRTLSRACLAAVDRALAVAEPLIRNNATLCFCRSDPRMANETFVGWRVNELAPDLRHSERNPTQSQAARVVDYQRTAERLLAFSGGGSSTW